MSAAERIGKQLEAAMSAEGLTVDSLAEKTGRSADHIRAVLAGYPNSEPGTTMLDTVDEIAAVLRRKLDVV